MIMSGLENAIDKDTESQKNSENSCCFAISLIIGGGFIASMNDYDCLALGGLMIAGGITTLMLETYKPPEPFYVIGRYTKNFYKHLKNQRS